MIQAIIPVFAKVALWAGAVKGAHIVVSGAEKLTERFRPDVQPLVAGFGDVITTVIDPFDILGNRKERKERQASPVLDKRLQVEVSGTLAKANEYQIEASKALAAGKPEKGAFLTRQAQSARRWAQTAVALGKRGRTQAAIEIARAGKNPPMSAINAINGQSSESGKAVAVHLVDSINREPEPDYDALAASLDGQDDALAMVAGPPSKEDNEPVVAGSCCLACGLGERDSCSGSRKAVPESFVSGDEDEEGDEEFAESLLGEFGLDDGDDDDATLDSFLRG